MPAEKKGIDLKKFILDDLLPVLTASEKKDNESYQPDPIDPAWKKMPADVFKGTRNKTLGMETASKTKCRFG